MLNTSSNDNVNNIPLLTVEELNYFKNNGNNATLFVHGFDVERGTFGYHINDVTITEKLSGEFDPPLLIPEIVATTSSAQCAVLRNLENLRQQFPQIPVTAQTINGQDHESFLNGTGAHNRLLHMEYNLNCAASGTQPFDWKKHGINYTRALAIFWPSDVGVMNYLEALDPAAKTGIALVPLIQQLQKAGITIHIIAHSLGSRVVLTALQLMAMRGMINTVEHVFLWQAAVPNNALLPSLPCDLARNCFPQAHLAMKKITVLYSSHDDVLWAAYRLAMGDQNLQISTDNYKYAKYLSYTLQVCPALGYAGPDDLTIARLGNKLIRVDQSPWLYSHSGMFEPSQDLFEHVYKTWIISEKYGIKNFGQWPIR